MLGLVSKRMGAMRIHTSAVRLNTIQNAFLKEISAFKPKPASASDAAAVTKAWKQPAAPATPSVEGDASAIAAYAEEPVEVVVSTNAEEAPKQEGDWFPIPQDPVDEHH